MQNDQDRTIASDAPVLGTGDLQVGTTIDDKYQILSIIGRGGMGAVYRAQQKYLGKDFALKILDLHQRNEATARRFRQEARTAAQLQHPNLVEVHDFGEFGDEQPYLVMDLIEGTTLSEVLKSKGSLSIEYVVSLCIQICFGLMYAHDKGVVHRDIKPGNIMLLHPERQPAEGSVKIVDFGIAKLMQSEAGEMHALTQTGELFGSPIYMSPEQCKGAAVDKRSDIYSLGCVVYECLTSTPPFLGDTAMSTMLRRLSEKPASLKEATLGGEFPAALERVVSKMLATNPEDRYQELGSLVKDLIAIQRPDDGVRVSSASKERAPKDETKGVGKTMQLIVAGIIACALTAIFDRTVIYPSYFEPNDRAISKAISGENIAGKETGTLSTSTGAGNGIRDTFPLANSTEFDQVTNSASRVSAFVGSVVDDPLAGTGFKSVGFPPGAQKITRPILVMGDKNGERQEFIFFPDDFGKIYFGDHESRKAHGPVAIPPGVPIKLKFNEGFGTNPDALQNITAMNLVRVDFPGKYQIKDENISRVDKLKNTLEEISIEEAQIKSLRPLYEAKKLVSLEAGCTLLPSSEFLQLKGFPQLTLLSFGPMPNAEVIFNELAKSNNIKVLSYQGEILLPNGAKQDFSSKQIAALSKLKSLKKLTIQCCPAFDDKKLEELLPLRNLELLKISDCSLSSKSVETLSKFKKLKTLMIDDEKFTPGDVAIFKRRYTYEHRDSRKGSGKTRGRIVEYLN